MGILQTWLLYHNALSAGVVIEDILRHARKTKERASDEDENALAELKAQLAEQEKTIRMMLEEKEREKELLRLRGPDSSAGKPLSVTTDLETAKKGLLSGFTHNIPSYGSTEAVVGPTVLKSSLHQVWIVVYHV